ncbi:MAG: chorismate mutase [Chloroflexota bacterium]|nr:chorismate mutase [Chloroflexota bacterium]
MWCRGIRGATVVPTNDKKSVVAATKELLQEMVRVNRIETEDIAAALFTTTSDLNAEFPAVATRELGWTQQLALLCGHEMNVPSSLPRCVRILMLVNTDKKLEDIVHIYLGEAKKLLAGKMTAHGDQK